MSSSTSGVTPPGIKSEYLFFGIRRASSVAGYHISVTRVRGFLVKLSVRLLSTRTVVVTPTGYGPAESGAGDLTGVLDEMTGAITCKATRRNNVTIAGFNFLVIFGPRVFVSMPLFVFPELQ